MARAEAKWCSYKRTTIVVCSINIFVALYVLHSFTSVYMYTTRNDTQRAFRYTPDQVRKMDESNRIRKQLEPVQLIKLIKGLKEAFFIDEKVVQVPQQIKQKIADEILATLRGVNAGDNATAQREAVESWRRKKLKEARRLINRKTSNSTIAPEEASVLAQALDVDWGDLAEEIGLWIPVAIINKEHDDKPEGEEEFDNEIIAGRRLPPECNVELHTDYGGDAVRWGLTHPKESAYECCMACLNQAKNAGPNDKKCNIWVYCPSETGCHSPDIYQHKHQECWLKYVNSCSPLGPPSLSLLPTMPFLLLMSDNLRMMTKAVPLICKCRQRNLKRLLRTGILNHTEMPTQMHQFLFHGCLVLSVYNFLLTKYRYQVLRPWCFYSVVMFV